MGKRTAGKGAPSKKLRGPGGGRKPDCPGNPKTGQYCWRTQPDVLAAFNRCQPDRNLADKLQEAALDWLVAQKAVAKEWASALRPQSKG